MQAGMTGVVTHARHQAVDRARYEHTNPRWIESRFVRATSQMRDRKNSRARGYDRYGNPNSIFNRTWGTGASMNDIRAPIENLLNFFTL
jgi:hypothetical protein